MKDSSRLMGLFAAVVVYLLAANFGNYIFNSNASALTVYLMGYFLELIKAINFPFVLLVCILIYSFKNREFSALVDGIGRWLNGLCHKG